MKNISRSLVILFLISFSLSGCSFFRTIAGRNLDALEEARSYGVSKTYNMSYNDTFDYMQERIKDKDLTIYMSSRSRGCIVVMGFYQQLNTTEVGVFFDILSENSTDVTLSSLSATALEEAEMILFSE